MSDRWERALGEARLAWPGIDVDGPELRRNVEALASKAAVEIDSLQLSDLVLALACAVGNEAAIGHLDRTLIAQVPVMLARVERDPAVLDEVRQRVRVRILVGEAGASPRIGDYAGRGTLASWVRVVALRVHANLRRDQARVTHVEGNLDAPRGSDGRGDAEDRAPTRAVLDSSPELVLARQRYGAAFEEALRASLGALEARDRTLLRLVYVDGIGLDRLGTTYGVHKSTVSRWVTAARERVLTETIRRVSLALALGDPREVESLLAMVRSDLDLSLGGVFPEVDDAHDPPTPSATQRSGRAHTPPGK